MTAGSPTTADAFGPWRDAERVGRAIQLAQEAGLAVVLAGDNGRRALLTDENTFTGQTWTHLLHRMQRVSLTSSIMRQAPGGGCGAAGRIAAWMSSSRADEVMTLHVVD
jgi:hypothetical protein